MKRFCILCIVTCLMAVAIASCNFNATTSGAGDIVVASKDFTEQDILGELLAQQIEDTTNLKVTRRPRLGGSFVCHNAIISGQIDAYIEYTGTAFTAVLKQQAVNDPKVVHEQLKQAYAKQFNLEVMPSLGFENTFAMIIRGEDAKRYNIQTLSESAKYTPQWRGGFGYEFLERKDGFPGLAKTYGLRFAKPPQIMDLGLIYRALIQKQVDMVAGNSTDGQISRLGLVVLQDDKQYFPPYEAAPIVRKATLDKYPQLRTAINQLSGKIRSDEMRQLNNLVEGELQDIKTVVREFRKSQGL
ncbi:glycine betaine ABC transporter substrate-binding protein [Nodularia spumigena]|uniref:glycine betaine ABC transporter substrate-binding protein n=1 Tax=Nodularia spumigena TaxID=70799 RepID=UPI00232FA351|nr:glycine betaine ABC transporter substrate-binding protein [Nodularia spumigena]MDB9355543.1 glycine betaine ABC transporter substrate-binding protein [Nodularia spumigena CS-587/03]MDB9319741.1 glycine betaine ABC transporter substrate-binding protein [Nodularia spumigena CS-590/01A]MDB9326087.1 glycine betaine ABC transporter substrate-binding protein [Nodularia spumigena CS-590/02]MDB9336720.1 glycine betaine ABC transporter substrate-binding protein [Nodularia spumigena CS-590/01]MDB9338